MGGCASRSATLSNVDDFDDDDPPILTPEKEETPVNVEEETLDRAEAKVQKE